MDNGELRDVGKPKKGNRPLGVLDRLIQAATADEVQLGSADDPAREAYPALWDSLTRTTAGKSHVKTPSKLTIQLGPGGVIVTWTDADLGHSMDLAAPTLADVFAAVETALNSLNPPIKRWGKKQPTLRKRKSNS